jgi:hypothetical protein
VKNKSFILKGLSFVLSFLMVCSVFFCYNIISISASSQTINLAMNKPATACNDLSTLYYETGLERGQAQTNWSNEMEYSLNTSRTSCEKVTGQVAKTGTSALKYSGMDNSDTISYHYFKVFDVNISIVNSSVLDFYIYPQQDNGRFVSVDLSFTDGSSLRNSSAVDQFGHWMHPASGHGGNIALNTWTKISSNIGTWLAGKTVDKILIAYDHAPGTGVFSGYLDDISIKSNNIDDGAAKAVDGDMNTQWISTDGSGAHWLTLDLGQVCHIERYVIYNAGANGEPTIYNTSAFKIQTSNDGNSFVDADTVTGNTANIVGRNIIMEARYIKLNIIQGEQSGQVNQFARINNFEIFGTVPYDFSDSPLNERIGATHWRGYYRTQTGETSIDNAAYELKALGSKAIKLNINDLATSYPLDSWPGAGGNTLAENLQYDCFKRVFGDPFFKTYLLVCYERPNINYFDGVSVAEKAQVENQFYDAASYLLNTYSNTGKVFILSNWEGDNMFGYSDGSLTAQQGIKDYFYARTEGIRRAQDDANMNSGCLVFSCVEVNKLKYNNNNGYPKLVDFLVPTSDADMFSYSDWETVDKTVYHSDPNEVKNSVKDALDLLISKANGNKYFAKGKNIIIGEFGAAENLYDANWQKSVTQAVIEAGYEKNVQFMLYWELFSNEPLTSVTPGDPNIVNSDLSGYWLIRPDGTKTPTYDYLQNILMNNSMDTESFVTGVTLDKTTLLIGKWATNQLSATVNPSNAINKEVTWHSSNTAVATVSATGLVKAVEAGTATITVTTVAGGKTATCLVTVTQSNVSGIADGQVYDMVNGDLIISYSEGVATLNGTAFSSYDTVNEVGEYILIVTDALNSSTVINFTVVDTTPPISFGVYIVSNDNIVTNVLPNTSVGNFKLAIALKRNTSLLFSKADASLVGTNTKFDFINGNQTVTYSIVIFGDINGDGLIDVFDLVSMKSHLLKINILGGEYFKAGDIFNKGRISITDLLALKKDIIGIKTIEQNVLQ